MKKSFLVLIIIAVVIVVLVVYYFVFPYKIVRICFGDVCPENGGVFLLYKFPYTKEQCLKKGAYPVEGIGWTYRYAGCSPIKGALSR